MINMKTWKIIYVWIFRELKLNRIWILPCPNLTGFRVYVTYARTWLRLEHPQYVFVNAGYNFTSWLAIKPLISIIIIITFWIG